MRRAKSHWKRKLLDLVARGRSFIRHRVPPGYRWIVGLVLIVLSAFSFLPVLGLWMLPLGLAVVAMDMRPLWRRLRR